MGTFAGGSPAPVWLVLVVLGMCAGMLIVMRLTGARRGPSSVAQRPTGLGGPPAGVTAALRPDLVTTVDGRYVTVRTSDHVVSALEAPGGRGYRARRDITIEHVTEYTVSTSDPGTGHETLPQVGVMLQFDLLGATAAGYAEAIEAAIRSDATVRQCAAEGRWDAARQRAQTVAGERVAQGVSVAATPAGPPDPGRAFDVNVILQSPPTTSVEVMSSEEAAQRYPGAG